MDKEKRDTELRTRVSEIEKARTKRAAAMKGVTVSDFVRLAVNEATACLDGSDILQPRKKLAA